MILFSFFMSQVLLCLVHPVWNCDLLVGEEGASYFAFLWFVAYVLSVVVYLLFSSWCHCRHCSLIVTTLYIFYDYFLKTDMTFYGEELITFVCEIDKSVNGPTSEKKTLEYMRTGKIQTKLRILTRQVDAQTALGLRHSYMS